MTACPICGAPAREGRLFCNLCDEAAQPVESDHENDIREYGECTTCGSDDPAGICAASCGECDECGAFLPGKHAGNVCDACVRELGGEG